MNHWKSPPKKGGVKRLHDQWQQEADAMPPQEKDDPLKTVREARARQTGRPESEVLVPIFAEETGRAIEDQARDKDEAAKLWRMFLDLDRAEEIYCHRHLGQSRFPNVAKLEYVQERFETRDDDRPDLRTDDEKERDAVNAWRRWQGYLKQIFPHERKAIYRATRQMDELHRGQAATVHGRQFVKALRMLRDVVEARG